MMKEVSSNQQNASTSGTPGAAALGGGQPAAPNNSAIHGISTSGVDPFLGQAHNSAVSHTKQSSTDSGLGTVALLLVK